MVNIGVLKNLARAKKYVRGATLADGGSDAALYIVLRGEIGLFSADQSGKRISTVGPGDFFGEEALFADRRMTCAALALTDVIAVPVYADGAVSFLRDEPEMALELLRAMCERAEKSSAASDNAVLPEPAETPGQNPRFVLFPKDHTGYRLPIDSGDTVHLLDKHYECPICKKEFAGLMVKNSRLIHERTDKDMRIHYQGIDPMYYDVLTCPNCLYSALADMFANPERTNAEKLMPLRDIQAEVSLHFGREFDTLSVFAGYYLALFCTPICFVKPYMAVAKLLLRLSRIYGDCGDDQMEQETAKKALDAYLDTYVNTDVTTAQEQQIYIVIGELYLKLNDLKNAKNYFFKAKIVQDGTAMMKKHAENRIEDVREMEKEPAEE